MKNLIIVQTLESDLRVMQNLIPELFPKLMQDVKISYESNFEKALTIIPKDGEPVIITSNVFHDEKDELLKSFEKDGNKLGELVKRINPNSKVFVFSSHIPRKRDYIDGFFPKGPFLCDHKKGMQEAFYEFGLTKRPSRISRIFKEMNEFIPWWGKVILPILFIAIIILAIQLIKNW